VDLSKPNVVEQQRANFEVGVELTKYVRELEPAGITISVGGEIGEVGKENSNEKELRAYLDNFNELLEKEKTGAIGISKISIQTGTSHGGVPLPDGTVADVNLDFDTLEILSRISRESYGLAGAVQHGASTLPQNLFHKFPELETAEIHLATDFQNMTYGSSLFPNDFKEEIYTHLRKKFASEKKNGETDEQFIYKTRKKGFGEFKAEFWKLSKEIRDGIGKELESKTDFLFDKLAVKNTRADVVKTVQQTPIYPELDKEISACQ
jgi:fructose/tagatose bisphosphate aldolase